MNKSFEEMDLIRAIHCLELLFEEYQKRRDELARVQDTQHRVDPEANGESIAIALDNEMENLTFDVEDLASRLHQRRRAIQDALRRLTSSIDLARALATEWRLLAGLAGQLFPPKAIERNHITELTQLLVRLVETSPGRIASRELNFAMVPLLAEMSAIEVPIESRSRTTTDSQETRNFPYDPRTVGNNARSQRRMARQFLD